MNTLVIVLLAAVVLFAAYVLYGRWLAKKWGIDPAAKTPAVRKNDGKDYVPTNGWTVFSHQFSSIAGAGPVTGAIQAAAFGWVPVLLWVLIGGIFFGAVTDFGALYASVKNEGKSMGMLIEKYIGKLGRKLFLLFCWLFCGIVIAAFADMVAGTFNAYTVVDGVTQLAEAAQTNGAAGMVSIMFMVFAVVFGLVQKKWNLSGWKEAVLGVLFIAASFAVGMNCPLIYGKSTWELHHVRLHLLRGRASNVASQAAARLHDDVHVHRYDRGRSRRPSGRAPHDEFTCLYELQHLPWLDVPHPVRHGGLRRSLRLPQPRLLRYIFEDG